MMKVLVVMSLIGMDARSETMLGRCADHLDVEIFKSESTPSYIVKTTGVKCEFGTRPPCVAQQCQQQEQCQQQQQQSGGFDPNKIDLVQVQELHPGEATHFRGELYVCSDSH